MGRLLPDTSMPGSSARLDTQDADGIRDYKGTCRCPRLLGQGSSLVPRRHIPDYRPPGGTRCPVRSSAELSRWMEVFSARGKAIATISPPPGRLSAEMIPL